MAQKKINADLLQCQFIETWLQFIKLEVAAKAYIIKTANKLTMIVSHKKEKIMFCDKCEAELKTTDDFNTEQIEASPEQSNRMMSVGNNEQYDKGDKNKNFLGGIQHPWRRFFARTVDVMSIGILIFFLFLLVLGYLFPQNINGFIKFIENPILAGIALYLLWLPFEALFLSAAGTTPAKWIFGIRVTKKTGEKLSYTTAFKRAFLVFVQGEGLGIPFVTLFTRLFAYQRITKTGTTLWDTSIDSIVTHKKWGLLRASASVFITLVVLVFMSILNQIGNS